MLTAPPDVRRVLALRPEALTAAGRIFVEEIGRWQRQQATAHGIEGGETGAVTFVQRFSAMLQSFVHDHVVALDAFSPERRQAAPPSSTRDPKVRIPRNLGIAR